jgi:hypothetical protein
VKWSFECARDSSRAALTSCLTSWQSSVQQCSASWTMRFAPTDVSFLSSCCCGLCHPHLVVEARSIRHIESLQEVQQLLTSDFDVRILDNKPKSGIMISSTASDIIRKQLQ